MATTTRMPLLALLFGLLALLAIVPPAAGLMTLSDDDLHNLPSPGDDFDIHNGKLLAPLLIPRVPGTEGSLRAQKHFVDFFKANLPKWTIEWQNSTSKTPATGNKDIPFSNLIFRRDPPWAPTGDVSRLTLVAHYDSKYEPAGFIGAIDSAAPCAMLMHVARSVEDALKAKWDKMQENGEADGLEEAQGVQILFLDGEEAFVRWTDTDSLYGSRSLAEQWESEFHPSMSTYRTPLDSISLFVLLDLLGSKSPNIPSYFLTTHWAYRNMANIERRLRGLKILETKPARPFLPDADKSANRFNRGFIDDDHAPFMERGVDILHIIPSPFPDVWHKIEDDGEHLDMPTVRDWAKITTAFVVEWMGIQDYMPKMKPTRQKRSVTTGATTSRRTEL
ncbi:Fc.00g022690.m01.CDS01 [Cosmosporella sp. VM-42]